MNIGVNRLKMSETKKVENLLEKEMQSSSNKGKTEDDLREIKLRDEMDRIYSDLKTNKKRMYSKDELKDSVNEIIQRKNIKQSQSELEKIIDSLVSEKLEYREIKDIDFDPKLGKLMFSMLHDSFDISQFRDKVYTSLQDLYFSISIEVSSPFALVFVNSNPLSYPKIRDLLRKIVHSDFTIQTVKWEDKALRDLSQKYGSEITSLGATGIEGFINARANAKEGLNTTVMKNNLDKGKWTAVKFNFKDLYPSNHIFINGRSGYLSSDLSDDDLKKFTKNYLMPHST